MRRMRRGDEFPPTLARSQPPLPKQPRGLAQPLVSDSAAPKARRVLKSVSNPSRRRFLLLRARQLLPLAIDKALRCPYTELSLQGRDLLRFVQNARASGPAPRAAQAPPRRSRARRAENRAAT